MNARTAILFAIAGTTCLSARQTFDRVNDGNSWASALRHAGLQVVPVVQGLAEYDGIVQIWLDTAAQILTAWDTNHPET